MHGVTFKSSKILQLATVTNWTGTEDIIIIIIIIIIVVVVVVADW